MLRPFRRRASAPEPRSVVGGFANAPRYVGAGRVIRERGRGQRQSGPENTRTLERRDTPSLERTGVVVESDGAARADRQAVAPRRLRPPTAPRLRPRGFSGISPLPARRSSPPPPSERHAPAILVRPAGQFGRAPRRHGAQTDQQGEPRTRGALRPRPRRPPALPRAASPLRARLYNGGRGASPSGVRPPAPLAPPRARVSSGPGAPFAPLRGRPRLFRFPFSV